MGAKNRVKKLCKTLKIAFPHVRLEPKGRE